MDEHREILPSLPLEVLLQIALPLRRLDYVMLSSTCRSLREMLNGIPAWNARIARMNHTKQQNADDLGRLFARIKTHRRDYARMKELTRLFLGDLCEDGDTRPIATVALVGHGRDRQWLVATFDSFFRTGDGDGASVFTDNADWWHKHTDDRHRYEVLTEPMTGDGRCAIVDAMTTAGLHHKRRISGFCSASASGNMTSEQVREHEALLILPTYKGNDGEALRLWRVPMGHPWYLSCAHEDKQIDEFAMHMRHLTVAMRKEKIDAFAILLRKDAPYTPRIVPKYPMVHRLAFAEDVF
ncbi:F-box domain-containing protein [Medusavirus stheno T3]|uniref:F-box domain-containing protein n=1 Tax=Medusavirus stheno T3 TaxID=3069717 RepID=A0A7S8BDH5_9VIRU|nr:F-box domain-containing protein [Acanthamoeba castellanii medusavirus]QPB44496.1 F-box domain-containing protein [Medusavirus stheno T3]